MSERALAATPRLLRRQRTLLSLLRAFGGEVGERDFQRLLFDYSRQCREQGVDAPYDFVSHGQEPRSFTAVADRDKLARRGILTVGAWHLTSEGHRISERLKNRDVTVFAARRQRRTGDFRAPGNGEAAVMGHDRVQTAEANGSLGTGLLATIGYEGRSYEGYFNEVLRHGVARLCDVRSNPVSRKWGFSKRLLSQGCEELGLRYESFPELGIASGHRAGLGDRTAYERLFARYESATLPQCRDTVARIARWIDGGERVAITCYERDFRDCHRSRLATAIVRTAAKPLRPKHL